MIPIKKIQETSIRTIW